MTLLIRNRVQLCGRALRVSGQIQSIGSCEHGNVLLGTSVTEGKFID
jgi:hypothetical protein